MFHDIDEVIENNFKKISFKEEKANYIKYYKNYLVSILPDYLETINDDYTIETIFSDENKILFYSNDKTITEHNIISIIVYKKYICSPKKIHYNIFLLGINKQLRKCGYGSHVLHEFFVKIKSENKLGTKINILLESVESSIKFYKSIGFRQIKKLIKYSHFFDINEKQEHSKNTMLLEYCLR